MMARNLSRARGSSRAEPCSVSTKPSIEASGVRNSWLALAMKSARMRSTRRDSVKSRSVSKVATTWPDPAASGATQTSKRRSIGTRSLHSTVSASPFAMTRRNASMTSGVRKARTKGSPSLMPGSSAKAGLLAATGRPSAPTITAGSGIAPTSLAANGDCRCSASARAPVSFAMDSVPTLSLRPHAPAGRGHSTLRPPGLRPPWLRAASANGARPRRRRATPSRG